LKKVLSIFKDYYYYLYIFLLVTAVVSIPYSRALLSCAQISLASLWILSGDFKKKYFRFKENKVILLILIIFFLHILGLIHTTDFHTAFKDIKIKLPLLLFPVVIGTSEKLRMKELKLILIAFSVSLIMNAIWGMFGF
jgi:O-antigen ligase